ncbi:AAA family ATPase [Vibrio sp. JC009]|uniref:ExeA family protein n=1 Tax=Vibrio sp. JC009 TaxID=2912314 RepID=UPI0023AF225F|nr:AAA family ATPase [Vibrio sp. JC009]WED21548.1 AAA family ATPase [Vibrio sp. JC009]
MYQTFFGLNQAPFGLTPDTGLFHGLPPHYEAIQTVISSIEMGEGVIKVTGEVGTGKTMVCRMLLNQLQDSVQLIYLPNPVLSADELKKAIAKELDIIVQPEQTIVDAIQMKLLEIHQAGKRSVAIIDEAQALSDEALETLRLFGNFETEESKLLQLVIIGQPELDARLQAEHLRQFRQRITFNATLRPLDLDEASAYISHRLQTCGGRDAIFNLAVKKAIWKSSKGIPRLINQICHKSLILAFNEHSVTVTNKHLYAALQDTYDARKPRFKTPYLWGWS